MISQPYPCICKEAVSGFEPMTNKLLRYNFTAAPGLVLTHLYLMKKLLNALGISTYKIIMDF